MSGRGVVLCLQAAALVVVGALCWRVIDLRDQVRVLEAERAFRNIEAETGRSCVPLLGECVEILRGEVARRER